MYERFTHSFNGTHPTSIYSIEAGWWLVLFTLSVTTQSLSFVVQSMCGDCPSVQMFIWWFSSGSWSIWWLRHFVMNVLPQNETHTNTHTSEDKHRNQPDTPSFIYIQILLWHSSIRFTRRQTPIDLITFALMSIGDRIKTTINLITIYEWVHTKRANVLSCVILFKMINFTFFLVRWVSAIDQLYRI